MRETLDRVDMRVLSCRLIHSHWHLVPWPRRDGDLSKFIGWLTLTHSQRCRAHFRTTGTEPLYQGRLKSFPLPDDEHFLTVCRSVERNAVRTNLVRRAEDWLWRRLWHQQQRDEFSKRALSAWPVPCPHQGRQQVSQSQSASEVANLRRSVNRNAPFDDSN